MRAAEAVHERNPQLGVTLKVRELARVKNVSDVASNQGVPARAQVTAAQVKAPERGGSAIVDLRTGSPLPLRTGPDGRIPHTNRRLRFGHFPIPAASIQIPIASSLTTR